MLFANKQKDQTSSPAQEEAATHSEAESVQAIPKTPNPPPQKANVGIDNYFSDSFRRVLIAAGSEAKNQNAPDIDTQHLLLGILIKKDKVMENILEKLKISSDELEQSVREKMKIGKEISIKLTFSPRAKQVLMFADEQRRSFHHHSTNPEHLFLGLIREGEGVAAQTLKKFGVEQDMAEQAVISVVGRGEEKDVLTGSGSTPMLDKLGEDLCAKAREGKLDPVIGRAEEIERTVHILARRRKNNPVLIGDPGVGKTAIIEGLAYRIITGNVPDILKGKRIVAITITALLAGASKRGEFEERLQKIIQEVRASEGDVILFIDEIHTLISEGTTDAANILKPALARGELHCIGATTPGEYHQYIEQDAALERRFQSVLVPEPSFNETFQILQGVRDKYEAFHKVKISDEILKTAIKLTTRYINDRFLPDKAFDLIDEASVMCKIPSFASPNTIQKLETEIKQLQGEQERAKQVVNLDEITRLEKEIADKKNELNSEQEKATTEKSTSRNEIREEHLAKIISRWTGVPIENLNASETQKLMTLSERIHADVIGQDEAVNALVQAVKRGRAGIKNPTRPVGSFLFMGPSGVGKTEVCKALALNLFGTKDAMIRFDMSEFMEKHAAARLLGPPPGYVGYEKGGELTEAVRKNSYAILLFDEVEKAHPDVFNILLQILDDGRLTDNHGRLVSFKNTIIVCTSNMAAQLISDAYANGVPQDEDTKKDFFEGLKRQALPELKKFFRPELINRFEELIFFEPLTIEHIVQIVDIFFRQTKELLFEKNITIHLSNGVKKFIALNGGFDPQFGARPLRRALVHLVEDPLADALVAQEFEAEDHIVVDLTKDAYSGKETIVFKKGIQGADEDEEDIIFKKEELENTSMLTGIESEVNAQSMSNEQLAMNNEEEITNEKLQITNEGANQNTENKEISVESKNLLSSAEDIDSSSPEREGSQQSAVRDQQNSTPNSELQSFNSTPLTSDSPALGSELRIPESLDDDFEFVDGHLVKKQ